MVSLTDFAHRRKNSLNAKEGTGQIYGKHLVPAFKVGTMNRIVTYDDASIVDEDVDMAMLFEDAGDNPLPVGGN